MDGVQVSMSSFSEGYNPELPVLKSAVLYIFIELLHVVKMKPPNGRPCWGQLFLTRAVVKQRQEKKRVSGLSVCVYLIYRKNVTYLMEVLSSSISSRSLFTSSCICCLSCWSFPMCSTVFCNVTALLI